MSGVAKAPAKLVRTKPIDVEAACELVASPRWAANVRVDEATGCHVWVGSLKKNGYGQISHLITHRVAVVAATGQDIAPGLTIDHLCRNRACVNPEHLEAVSMRTNTLRGASVSAKHAAKTCCPRGHALNSENLVASKAAKGARSCITCDREHARMQHALIRAAHKALGITRSEYRAKYGNSRTTARAIIAANSKPAQAELFEVSA